jgi:hypothetical protein
MSAAKQAEPVDAIAPPTGSLWAGVSVFAFGWILAPRSQCSGGGRAPASSIHLPSGVAQTICLVDPLSDLA